MKKLLLALAAIATPLLIAATPTASTAFAVTCASAADCVTSGVDGAGGTTAPKAQSGPQIIKLIVDVLLFVVGAVSVVMIVIGGLKYVLSNGDSSQVKSAKDTIFYAVIGLVVAGLGYAIVNWVISMLFK